MNVIHCNTTLIPHNQIIYILHMIHMIIYDHICTCIFYDAHTHIMHLSGTSPQDLGDALAKAEALLEKQRYVCKRFSYMDPHVESLVGQKIRLKQLKHVETFNILQPIG